MKLKTITYQSRIINTFKTKFFFHVIKKAIVTVQVG
jgi:hypothetical protein